MRTISVQQGSREWLALRAQHHTASEAPAAMGASRYQTRDQLLHQKHTGITQEIDGHTQALFDRGHATEAMARALLEEYLGEPLYAVTGISDDGTLLASFDGITLDDTTGFEHKLYSERLAQQVLAGDLEPHYYWQLEQQILVGGLERVIFVTSDGTRENWAQMTYRPVPGRAEQLLAGWAQFAADLAAYTPTAVHAAPIVGRAPEHLPALRIEVSGAVTASNLAEFKATAMAAIAGVNRELATDADFADAEASVKWCSEVESRLDAAKQHALSQTVDIEALFRTMDDIAAEAKRVRLELDKLVKQRKEQLRGEIVAGGVAALRAHIASLNQSLGRDYLPTIAADFGAAVKGKRSLDSMQGAVNDELARAKIEADAACRRIQANLQALHADGVVLHLFPDVATLVHKQADDFSAVVQARMAQHREAEKARRDADDARRVAAAASERASDATLQALVQAAAPAIAEATPLIAMNRCCEKAASEGVAMCSECGAYSAAFQSCLGPGPSDDGERINLGAINEHLQLVTVNASQLAALGFDPVSTAKGAKLYRECDLPAIRAALISHLSSLALQTA